MTLPQIWTTSQTSSEYRCLESSSSPAAWAAGPTKPLLDHFLCSLFLLCPSCNCYSHSTFIVTKFPPRYTSFSGLKSPIKISSCLFGIKITQSKTKPPQEAWVPSETPSPLASHCIPALSPVSLHLQSWFRQPLPAPPTVSSCRRGGTLRLPHDGQTGRDVADRMQWYLEMGADLR